MTAPSVVRRNLSAITWDGAFFSVMLGCGERYLQAFAVELRYGALLTGLVATLPVLGGAFLQLVSPWAVVRVGSQKRWVVGCSAVQVAAWIPLVVGAALGHLPPVVLFGAVTIYWAMGFASGPAWTAWVETLIPDRLRAHYFARRSAICQVALFLALIAAGSALHLTEHGGRTLVTFAVLFAIAAVARAISTAFLVTQTEPVPLAPDMACVPFHDFLVRLRTDRSLRLLFCVVPMQFAVQMAEPFFAPYVLERLHADYAAYLILIAASFLGRIVVLPAAGTIARRIGARRVLWAGAMGMIPVAALWSLSTSFAWLTVVQLLAGLAWGCAELGTFLVYFEAVPHSERASAITAFTFVNAAAALGGSIAGATLLGVFGTDSGGYVALFAASTAMRLLALPLLTPLRRSPHATP